VHTNQNQPYLLPRNSIQFSIVDSADKIRFLGKNPSGEPSGWAVVGDRSDLIGFFESAGVRQEYCNGAMDNPENWKFDTPLPPNWSLINIEFNLETMGFPTVKNAQLLSTHFASMWAGKKGERAK